MNDTRPTPKMSERTAQIYLARIAVILWASATIIIWAVERFGPGAKPTSGDENTWHDWLRPLSIAIPMTLMFWAINAWQLHRRYVAFEESERSEHLT